MVALLLALVLGMPASAQTGRVALVQDENFRASPNGAIIGTLLQGQEVTVISEGGSWLEVEVEGYVWMASVSRTDRSGFDFVVSEDDGENLRERPRGDIMARLAGGALLEGLGSESGWAHVVRRGYLWAESARMLASVEAGRGPDPSRDIERRGGDDPSSASATAFDVMAAGVDGTTIVAAPGGGDTLAVAAPGTTLLLGGRRGGWVRVRLDGWAWLPPGSMADPPDSVGSGPTPPELAAEPTSHAGRTVTWELRFVAEERASAYQTDFMEGETYLLCRWGNDDHFVYVAVPEDQIGIGADLAPLEAIQVTGRVRTGASVLTSSPVIDLLSLRRGGMHK